MRQVHLRTGWRRRGHGGTRNDTGEKCLAAISFTICICGTLSVNSFAHWAVAKRNGGTRNDNISVVCRKLGNQYFAGVFVENNDIVIPLKNSRKLDRDAYISQFSGNTYSPREKGRNRLGFVNRI